MHVVLVTIIYYYTPVQVTGSCYRIVKSSYQKHSMTPVVPGGGFFSPRYTTYPNRSSDKQSVSNLQHYRNLQTISSSQPYRPKVDIVNKSFSLGGNTDSEEISLNSYMPQTQLSRDDKGTYIVCDIL